MSTTSNCPDLSRLVAHGHTFGAKIGKKSVSQVKHEGNILACKLLKGGKKLSEKTMEVVKLLVSSSHRADSQHHTELRQFVHFNAME